MRVISFKCVSKFVNCVSACVTGQMRENHAICVRVGNPDKGQYCPPFWDESLQSYTHCQVRQTFNCVI